MARKDRARGSSPADAATREAALMAAAAEVRARRRRTTWLGVQVPLPVTVQDTPEGVEIAMWMDRDSGRILASQAAPAGARDLLRNAFLRAMKDPPPPAKPSRPAAVSIQPPELVGQVNDLLKQFHIDIDEPADFSAVHEAIEDLLDSPSASLPDPLACGLTHPELDLFCERMATLWKVAPWRHVADSELMVVDGLTPEPIFVSVLGQAKEAFGFVVFLTEDGAAAVLGGDEASMGQVPSLVASFEPAEVFEPEWPAEIEKHGWRVGKKGVFPTAMRLGETAVVPTPDDMRLATTLAAVLAEFPFKKRSQGRLDFAMDSRRGSASWPASPNGIDPDVGLT